MIKNYLLDTNILLSNPNSIYGFEDNNVYLCGTTLQELDGKKNAPGELGYNAREAMRCIKSLIKEASIGLKKEEKVKLLSKGIGLPNGGKLFIEPDGVSTDNLPKGYSLDNPDNRIISSCVHMNNTYLRNNKVTLLTNDGGCYVNALACGVDVDDVRNERVEDKDASYTGHLDLEIEDWPIIDELYKTKSIEVSKIDEIDGLEYPLYENEFITLTSGNKCVLTVYKEGSLHRINDIKLSNGISPLNKMQTYAMWALLAEDIPLVILEGAAGTSKTFVSLACGMEQLDVGDHADSEYYKRLMISRPNNGTSDEGFGYLPGELSEKMAPLLASYYDNLEEILSKGEDEDLGQIRCQIEEMMLSGFLEICPLYTIRGRSIHNAYLICDEAQNASKLLIRDVVTRAGRNTKIVIAGDTRQVDNPVLDSRNNGLTYIKDSMKGSKNCAILKFPNSSCVRSILAEDAISRMK